MGEGFRLRIGYRIEGRLAHLSHLETIRSIERVIRRAGLPYAVTEGFNPHMKIAFGPALPVGAGSEGEYVDLRLSDYVAPDKALVALQQSAPENLRPISCEYIGLQDDAIDVAYPVSEWKVLFHCNTAQEAALKAALDGLVDTGFIEVVKKKGRKENIKRVEFEGRLVQAPNIEREDPGSCSVSFKTCQREGGALRPDKFLAAALENMADPPVLMSLTRVSLDRE